MNRRLKRWGIWSLVCIVALVGIILAIGHWGNGSSDGTVHVGKPAAQAAQKPSEPLALQTTYFTTVLPGDFTVRRQADTPSSATLLQLMVANQHQQFAVTVGTLPPGGLSAVGDYNLRATQTADYAPYRPAGMPVESTAFSATSGAPAFVVFWPHGSQYTEIALSSDGAATMPELFATFEQASHNWTWK